MYKLDEIDLENLEKVKEITKTDYKVENECISGKDMANIIDELLYEIKHLKEINELNEQYYQENWQPIYR